MPTNAHTVTSTHTSHSGMSMAPLATNRPAVNSSESPGRKKPISSPHSAKMIRQSTATAQPPMPCRITSGSSQDGRIDIVCTVADG